MRRMWALFTIDRMFHVQVMSNGTAYLTITQRDWKYGASGKELFVQRGLDARTALRGAFRFLRMHLSRNPDLELVGIVKKVLQE